MGLGGGLSNFPVVEHAVPVVVLPGGLHGLAGHCPQAGNVLSSCWLGGLAISSGHIQSDFLTFISCISIGDEGLWIGQLLLLIVRFTIYASTKHKTASPALGERYPSTALSVGHRILFASEWYRFIFNRHRTIRRRGCRFRGWTGGESHHIEGSVVV